MSGGLGSSLGTLYGTRMLLAVGIFLSLEKVTAKPKIDWALPRHSFTKTLVLDDRFSDWLLSASTVALEQRVQLLPPISDRFGVLWNKVAVASHNFDVTFTFFAKPTGGNIQAGGFVLWISPENLTESFKEAEIFKGGSWVAGLKRIGFDPHYVNKKNYRGCGIFFTASPSPGVSCVCNDGVKKVTAKDIKPVSGSSSSELVSWWWKPGGQVRVHVTSDGTVTGEILATPSPSWDELFTMPPGSYKQEWESSYVGFTGWSGLENYIAVDIQKMDVRNFDETKVGEDDTGLFDKRWELALGEGRQFIDQKSQAAAMQNITTLLAEYNAGFHEEGNEVKSDLFSLVEKLDNLKQNMNKVIVESEAIVTRTGTMQVDKLRSHVTNIRDMFTRDKHEHNDQITKVQSAAQVISNRKDDTGSVKSAAETVKNLEDQFVSSSLQAHYVLLVFVAVVALLGYLFFSRMRYYERKHYV